MKLVYILVYNYTKSTNRIIDYFVNKKVANDVFTSFKVMFPESNIKLDYMYCEDDNLYSLIKFRDSLR